MTNISVLTPSIRPKGLEITQESLKRQTFTDFEWHQEIGLGLKHDFNQAMNRMIRRSKGELIVIVQDYIKLPDDFLQKCWDAYQEDRTNLYTCPVGKSKSLDFDGDIKWDWRAIPQARMGLEMWEIDSGFCAKAILQEIGGFDERLDEYWSMDNVSVGRRAAILGYGFKCLSDNKCIAYDHDAFIEHPFRANYSPKEANEIMSGYDRKPRLEYL
jgi:hypothetical protein